MPGELAYTDEEILTLLDGLLSGQDDTRWNAFYENRARPCPFFVASPDESLVRWADDTGLRSGQALDLGCGHARNAIFLARRGFTVDAVDHSRTALDWADERVREAQVDVRLRCESVFDMTDAPAGFDLVYDAGCFHHLAPHRRRAYVERVGRWLKPGGWFGLVCFGPEGGSGYSDLAVYAQRSLGGGLGYSDAQLRAIWSRELRVESVRPMVKPDAASGLFGETFLTVLWARKPASP